ncbi:MAG: hypothetical protein ETSY1_15230 [Candidatus Entotheonella factor]|uniref:Uncharacterized protein n=1 Tax=Entotheonella factor TaxID=1429438 RepID=W4LPP2_ENTF1|nr:MAG: hypothetical protein ETSY1_15230 [Candidatus Entotheonella factor]
MPLVVLFIHYLAKQSLHYVVELHVQMQILLRHLVRYLPDSHHHQAQLTTTIREKKRSRRPRTANLVLIQVLFANPESIQGNQGFSSAVSHNIIR